MWSRNWTRIANSRSRIRPSSALCSSIRRFLSTFPGKRFAAVWGNGDYGRLGHGNLESHARPMPVASPAFEKEGLKSIACGGAHTLFLTGWFRFLHLTPFSPCPSDLRFPMGNLHLTVSQSWIHVYRTTWRVIFGLVMGQLISFSSDQFNASYRIS